MIQEIEYSTDIESIQSALQLSQEALARLLGADNHVVGRGGE